MSYLCRYGNKRRRRPIKSYDELLNLPTKLKEDDGVEVKLPHCPECAKNLPTGHPNCPRVIPICHDCGRGLLYWAEAGYVPWHRICHVCGSHWDLHPHEGFYRRAQFH